MSKIDWQRLTAEHDRHPERDAEEWLHALASMDDDPEEWNAAVDADPLMLFHALPEVETGPAEIEAMKEAGVAFEIVPGVTAASAAAFMMAEYASATASAPVTRLISNSMPTHGFWAGPEHPRLEPRSAVRIVLSFELLSRAQPNAPTRRSGPDAGP